MDAMAKRDSRRILQKRADRLRRHREGIRWRWLLDRDRLHTRKEQPRARKFQLLVEERRRRTADPDLGVHQTGIVAPFFFDRYGSQGTILGHQVQRHVDVIGLDRPHDSFDLNPLSIGGAGQQVRQRHSSSIWKRPVTGKNADTRVGDNRREIASRGGPRDFNQIARVQRKDLAGRQRDKDSAGRILDKERPHAGHRSGGRNMLRPPGNGPGALPPLDRA